MKKIITKHLLSLIMCFVIMLLTCWIGTVGCVAQQIVSKEQIPAQYGSVNADNTVTWQKQNVAVGSSVFFSWDAEGTSPMNNKVDANNSIDNLFDNNTATRMQYYIDNKIKQKPTTFYMTVTLPNIYIVDAVLLMAKNNYIQYVNGYIGLKSFEIYASANRSSLYTSQPIVTVNRNKTDVGSWFIADITSSSINKEIGYIGIKVLELNSIPNGTDHSGTLWIDELTVIGREKSGAVLYKSDNEVNNEFLSSLGENLLAEASMQVIKANGDSLNKASWIDGAGYYNINKLTDSIITESGDSLVRFNTDAQAMPLTILFNMQRSYKLNALSIVGIAGNNYQLSEYRVYISNDKENLIREENLILHYNNVPNYINNSNAGFAQVYNINGEAKGRYIAFVIEKNKCSFSYGYTKQFLRELGVYGSVDYGYQTNILKDTLLKIKINYTYYEITDSDVQTLTDNNTSAEPNVELPVFGKKARFVYDLNYAKSIKSFLIAGGSEQNEKLLREVKIYASQNEEDLYNRKNLIYTYLRNNTDNNRIIEYSLDKEKVYRYIAFEISDGSDGSMLISEIAAIGLSWQLNSRENQVLLTANSSVKPYLQNISSGSFYEVNTFADRDSKSQPDITSYIFDGNIGGKNTSIYGPQKGIETANLVVAMEVPASIDFIGFYGIQHKSLYNAKKIAVYVANDEQGLWRNAEPVAVIEDRERSGVLEAKFKATTGCFVRFCILEGADKSVCYGSEVTVISEISVYGCALASTKETYTPSFIDNNTGIELTVNPLNFKDCYDVVTSMTVNELDVQSLQAKGQYISNLVLKDGKAYEISLFDANGNLVTDIGGRTVTVTLHRNGVTEDVLQFVMLKDGKHIPLEFEVGNRGYACEFEYNGTTTLGLSVGMLSATLPETVGVADDKGNVKWNGTNIIEGILPTFSADANMTTGVVYGTQNDNGVYHSINKMTDGNINNRSQTYMFDTSAKTETYPYYINFDLGTDAVIDLLFIHGRLKAYEIFIYDIQESLVYSKQIASINRISDNGADKLALALGGVTARYISIKVTDNNFTANGIWGCGMLFLNEIAVLGSSDAEVINGIAQFPEKLGEVAEDGSVAWTTTNLLSEATATISWDKSGNEPVNYTVEEKNVVENIFNNNDTLLAQIYPTTIQTQRTVRPYYITLDMRKTVDVDEIYLNSSISEFEVYASDTRDDLYISDRIAYVNRRKANNGDRYVLSADVKGARYIGIKILDEDIQFTDYQWGCGIIRIYEIAVFGRSQGDINADKCLDAKDLAAIRQIILGATDESEYADLNADRRIDIIDLMRMKKYLAKIDTQLIK